MLRNIFADEETGKQRRTSDFRSRRFSFYPHPWSFDRREKRSLDLKKITEDFFRVNGDWSAIQWRLIEKKTMQNVISPLIRNRLEEEKRRKKLLKIIGNNIKLVFCLFSSFTLPNASSWFNPHKRIIVVDSLFTDSNKSNHHFSLSPSRLECQQWHEQNEKKKSTHSRFIGYCAVNGCMHVLLLPCYKSL